MLLFYYDQFLVLFQQFLHFVHNFLFFGLFLGLLYFLFRFWWNLLLHDFIILLLVLYIRRMIVWLWRLHCWLLRLLNFFWLFRLSLLRRLWSLGLLFWRHSLILRLFLLLHDWWSERRRRGRYFLRLYWSRLYCWYYQGLVIFCFVVGLISCFVFLVGETNWACFPLFFLLLFQFAVQFLGFALNLLFPLFLFFLFAFNLLFFFFKLIILNWRFKVFKSH